MADHRHPLRLLRDKLHHAWEQVWLSKVHDWHTQPRARLAWRMDEIDECLRLAKEQIAANDMSGAAWAMDALVHRASSANDAIAEILSSDPPGQC